MTARSHSNGDPIEHDGKKWVYSDTKRPVDPVGCYDCGLGYVDPAWIEAIIPDKVWNAIRPDGCGEGCGILCITCISRRLEKKGYKKVPVWLCGIEPLRAMSGDPGDDDNIDILRGKSHA